MAIVFQEHKHMVLLYDNEHQRDEVILRFINEGLKAGQLCIYGTIFVRYTEYFQSLCSRIWDYEKNVKNGNLLIVDFAPFYIAAMSNDLAPYEQVQKQLEAMFGDKEDLSVRFIGDATGFLFKNRHFDECVKVENWWQKNRIKEVTTLCVFERSLFEKYPFSFQKQRVLENHDVPLLSGTDRCEAEDGTWPTRRDAG